MADETRNSLDGRADVVVQAGRIGELHQHQHLHGADVPTPPVPYQLPPAPVHFEDRRDEQARIAGAVEGHRGQAGPLVVALTGIGGIGKTALAFHVARGLSDRYPDGVLYVDLDDLRRDGVVEVADAVGELLTGLGVAPQWLERSLGGRTKQLWSRTRDKKIAVLIDNARYGTEVLPLLPASDRGLVIVTSQGALYDLDGTAALDVPVGPLAVEDAVRLLGRLVDDPRLAAEPDAAAELARGCGGLPAALQVAGQWVRRYRRRSLPRLVAELVADLQAKGIPMVEAVWDAAYAQLAPDAARLYRLLPQIPGRRLREPAAAALLGCDLGRAGDALEDLEAAGLLEAPAGDEGWRVHDLVRGHAERRARQAASAEAGDDPAAASVAGSTAGRDTDPAGCDRGTADDADPAAADPNHSPDSRRTEGTRARRALIAWYRRQAARADLLAAGPRMTFAPLAEPPAPDVPDVDFPGRPEALRWLEAHRHDLYGCVRLAFEDGRYEDAWALCEPLWTHFLDHPHYADITDAFRTGVAAADRAECLPAMVRMRCQLARPLWEQGRYEEAAEVLGQALNSAAGLGDSPQERKLRASTAEFRGLLKAETGDWDGAAADFEAARAEHERIGNAYGVLLQTHLLGRTALRAGRYEAAVTLLRAAREMAERQQGRDRMKARTGFELGRALRLVGRPEEARPLVAAALDSARARGARADEARILEELALLDERLGDDRLAREHRAAALRIAIRYGGALPEAAPEMSPDVSAGASAGASAGSSPEAASGAGSGAATDAPAEPGLGAPPMTPPDAPAGVQAGARPHATRPALPGTPLDSPPGTVPDAPPGDQSS